MESRYSGDMMKSTMSDVRSLCKAVSEEEDLGQIRLLLDQLLQILEERQLMASLF